MSATTLVMGVEWNASVVIDWGDAVRGDPLVLDHWRLDGSHLVKVNPA